MANWKFIEPPVGYDTEEKIAYTEGAFNTLSQIHANLDISNDKEFDSLNIAIKKYMRNLKGIQQLEINRKLRKDGK